MNLPIWHPICQRGVAKEEKVHNLAKLSGGVAKEEKVHNLAKLSGGVAKEEKVHNLAKLSGVGKNTKSELGKIGK